MSVSAAVVALLLAASTFDGIAAFVLFFAWIVLAIGPTVVLLLGIDAVQRKPRFANACARLGLIAGTLAGPTSVALLVLIAWEGDRPHEILGLPWLLTGPLLLAFEAVIILIPWSHLRALLRGTSGEME